MRNLLALVCLIVFAAGCGRAPVSSLPAGDYKLFEAASTRNSQLVVVIDSRSQKTDRRLPWGTPSPDGRHFYSLGSDTLQDLDPHTGAVLNSVKIAGNFQLPPSTMSGIAGGLSQNGRWLVLQAFDSTPNTNSGPTATHMLIVDTSAPKVAARIDLTGFFEFDAVSNDGQRVYVIEYATTSSIAGSSTYRVRVYEVGPGHLGDYTVVDKGDPNEPMQGLRLSGVFSPDGQWLYSVYARENKGAFVHALNLTYPFAYCLELPGNGWSQDPGTFQWSLALSGDGRHLYAANGAMGLVTQIDNLDGMNPSIVRTGHIGVAGPSAGLLAQDVTAKEFGPNGAVLSHDGTSLVIAGTTGVVWVDTATLHARNHQLTAWTVWSLAASPDGNLLYVLNDAGKIAALSMDGMVTATFDPAEGYPMGLIRVEAAAAP